MEPGPVANPTTKRMTITMDRYLRAGTDAFEYDFHEKLC